VERGEDSGLAIGRHTCGLVETRLAQQSDGQIAAFGNPAILCRDGRLVDPFLELPNGVDVALFNLRADAIAVVGRGPRPLCPNSGGRARSGSLEERSSVHVIVIAVKSAGYNPKA